MSKLSPCKHLDYDGNYTNCHIETADPHFPDVRFWVREKPPYPSAPVRVQFCGQGRGRINDIFSCYNGEQPCYDPETEDVGEGR